MIITRAKLIQISPNVNKQRIDAFVKDFNQWHDEFGCSSPLQIVHFLAQVMQESVELRYTEEIASGAAYEWRHDLGNVYKGDGVRFKGRGFLQITGRANYQAYARSKWCNGDLVSHPEWLAKSPGNMKASLWFWWKSGCNALAANDDVKAVTKRINGGLNGYAQRQYYLRKAKRAFALELQQR